MIWGVITEAVMGFVPSVHIGTRPRSDCKDRTHDGLIDSLPEGPVTTWPGRPDPIGASSQLLRLHTDRMKRSRPRLWGLLFVPLVAGCALGQPPIGSASGQPTASAQIRAADLGFDPVSLRLPSGEIVAIRFDNRDPGILHNVTVASDGGDVVFRGETFAGIDSRTYVVAPLAPGEFLLLCDVHPTMIATLTVDP